MPCKANCNLRTLLLAKEERISRLQQVGRWLDALHQNQEPHQRVLTNTKKNIVSNDVVQAMAFSSNGSVIEKDSSAGHNISFFKTGFSFTLIVFVFGQRLFSN